MKSQVLHFGSQNISLQNLQNFLSLPTGGLGATETLSNILTKC